MPGLRQRPTSASRRSSTLGRARDVRAPKARVWSAADAGARHGAGALRPQRPRLLVRQRRGHHRGRQRADGTALASTRIPALQVGEQGVWSVPVRPAGGQLHAGRRAPTTWPATGRPGRRAPCCASRRARRRPACAAGARPAPRGGGPSAGVRVQSQAARPGRRRRAGLSACAKGPRVPRVPDAERGVREGRAAAAPRRGRLRAELLRALRAGRGAPRRRRRGPPRRRARRRGGRAAGRRPLPLPRPRGARAAGARRALRRRRGAGARTSSASASRRSPRWPPAASSSPRPSPCSSASCRSSCSRGRSSWRPATRSRSTRSSPSSPRWATSASSRCAGAASSPCAAASSTSTRRSATRCASSSGATRSSACAPSRCTRSAPPAPSTRATVYAAFEADTTLPEYETGLHQALAAWEREGREEAPDELFRRAGVRALAALAGRFTTVADVLAAGGLGDGRVQPRRDLPGAGRLRRRGGHGGRRRGRARAALRAARRGPRPARRRPAGRPRAARPAAAVPRLAAAVRGPRHRRRRARPARAWCATATACSSSSATRARRSAPPTGCAT